MVLFTIWIWAVIGIAVAGWWSLRSGIKVLGFDIGRLERQLDMARREIESLDVSYADLAERLGAMGVKESERNIANKIARGAFTAVFFIQCLEAIECHVLHLADV